MRVQIRGGSAVDLNQKDWLGAGGTANLYSKGGKCFKIYSDAKHIIAESKIQELSTLTHPHIIKPLDILTDSKGKNIGYTMKHLSNTNVLCQLFPKPFRVRNNINPDTTLKLVRNLQEVITHIHEKDILVVDMNEFNFLVGEKFDSVWAIDVDSYQTRNFAATAIMESIRDRHSNIFTKNTDWFSFAILSFQMFRGIHPYKGKHSQYTSLDERMLHNISVMNREVSFPQNSVLPESVIPPIYLQWFRAVLDDGKRVNPPTQLTPIIVIAQPTIKTLTGNLFDITEIDLFGGYKPVCREVSSVSRSGGELILIGKDGAYTKSKIIPRIKHVAFSAKYNTAIGAYVENGQIQFHNLSTNTPIGEKFAAQSAFSYQNRIYFKHLTNIFEVDFLELNGGDIKAMSKVVANVMQYSTQVFDGCIVQNMLGTYYGGIFPAKAHSKQIKLAELTGEQVVEAKYDHSVLMIISTKAGKYNRTIYKEDVLFSREEDVDHSGLNFITLDNGICINLIGNIVELFANSSKSGDKKVLTDDSVGGILLLKDGMRAIFEREGKFYQLKMK